VLYNFANFLVNFHSAVRNRHTFLTVFTGNLQTEDSTVSLCCEHVLRVTLWISLIKYGTYETSSVWQTLLPVLWFCKRACTVTSHFLPRSSFFTFIVLKIRFPQQRQYLAWLHPYSTELRKKLEVHFLVEKFEVEVNPLTAELNPICHLLPLLGAHHILHGSRVRVNYHNYKSKNVISILSQINPVHDVITYSSEIHINTIHSSRLSEWILDFRFSQETLICIFLSH